MLFCSAAGSIDVSIIDTMSWAEEVLTDVCFDGRLSAAEWKCSRAKNKWNHVDRERNLCSLWKFEPPWMMHVRKENHIRLFVKWLNAKWRSRFEFLPLYISNNRCVLSSQTSWQVDQWEDAWFSQLTRTYQSLRRKYQKRTWLHQRFVVWFRRAVCYGTWWLTSVSVSLLL